MNHSDGGDLSDALGALADLARSHGDEPWTVEWLRDRQRLLDRRDPDVAATVVRDVRARLPDLYQDFVVDHRTAGAMALLATLQRLTADDVSEPLAVAPEGAMPVPSAAALAPVPYRASHHSEIGIYLASAGAAMVILGCWAILVGGSCSDARRGLGTVLAMLGCLSGIATIWIRNLELRRDTFRAEDDADIARLVGIGQVFGLVAVWIVVHHVGCSLFGL